MLLISLMPYLGLYDKEIPEIANLQKYGERISIMEKKERVYASIDLDALDNNLENIQEVLTPGTKMIAVVKADAYGHGAVTVANFIQEKDYIWGFAVATVEEAEELRNHGITKPILILGYVFPEDYETLVQRDIRPSVLSLDMAEKIDKVAEKHKIVLPVHLALDTGMTRIGLRNPEKSIDEIKKIHSLKHIKIEGAFTHFARADEDDLTSARNQFALYMKFISLMKQEGIEIQIKHCNNSAGILWNREGDMQAVRPGITMYGIYPSDEMNQVGVALKPVMGLHSHVSYVKNVEAGVPVSYGGTYVTTKENTRIATVPIGYADGYPRGLSNKGCVLIHGKRAQILGRVCMDQFMVDVTDIPDVKQGDSVTLLGKDGDETILVEELSEISGRFPYEFVCCISKRVPRVYIHTEK